MLNLKDIFGNDGKKKWLLVSAIIFFAVMVLFSAAIASYGYIYRDRSFPNIFLGDLPLGGLNEQSARERIGERMNTLAVSGIKFEYGGHSAALQPIVSSADAEFAYEIMDFDLDKTVDSLFSAGRNGSWLNSRLGRIKLLFRPESISLTHSIEENKIINNLQKEFREFETPAQDAELGFEAPDKFSVKKENAGRIIDWDKALKDLRNILSRAEAGTVLLSQKDSLPAIYKKDCLNVEHDASRIIKAAPVELVYEKNKWKINSDILGGWLMLKKSETEDAAAVTVGLDETAITEYLATKAAPKIDIEPTDSKFKIEDGKVLEFQVGKEGKKLMLEESFDAISKGILIEHGKEIPLIATSVKSELGESDSNSFGIKEIIGTGESDFSGSPSNRRHNIRVGASSLGGLLIKPDQEFSVVGSLGEIDAANGYLPELVIKGNKTIPEYGGGLCQIGTTMFRTALESGLPITARRNHSYRVSYYEPAGTDAAIYDPQPDVRFKNDTGNYILIQSRIEGNKLYFDFWGTKDGRTVEKSKPTIYNIVKPGPTKIVESADLKPGEKKCTEKPHNGADAYFDYKVIYTGGETKEERFKSHYVPWQEVCLVGPTASSTPAAADPETDSGEKPGGTTETNVQLSTSTQP